MASDFILGSAPVTSPMAWHGDDMDRGPVTQWIFFHSAKHAFLVFALRVFCERTNFPYISFLYWLSFFRSSVLNSNTLWTSLSSVTLGPPPRVLWPLVPLSSALAQQFVFHKGNGFTHLSRCCALWGQGACATFFFCSPSPPPQDRHCKCASAGLTAHRRRLPIGNVCNLLATPMYHFSALQSCPAWLRNRTLKLICWARRHLVSVLKPLSFVYQRISSSHLEACKLHYPVTESQKNTELISLHHQFCSGPSADASNLGLISLCHPDHFPDDQWL